ncbi:peptide chain release factor N(5)-glutamine methyltransferase [Rhizobium sp. RU36D]|uniref:peptide chain release factor N(5)-glutamine methyltransferase n=1 Tax=Rhizobium sp. RU36D TaxID=1907415 RepID=UPI0009D88688|nr:peptide chain release factor N(5)-glutamine methyltransferase [Rhizobium sp. RU36D]SMC78427.1 release factor glutamine methyltransferase [Rhizobium sp. RU36D]
MTFEARSVAEWVKAARQAFAAAGIDDPPTDARVLVAGVLGLSPTDMILQGDRVPDGTQAERLAASIERRCNREPVHRILGRREFYGMDLAVSAGTLEPRPDTEILVDRALPIIEDIVKARGAARVLDIGTGTGAIALAILKHCPEVLVVGSDISPDALATAQSNANMHDVADRFTPLESHWFDAVTGTFDVILSNPPYIRTGVIEELSPEVRLFDPMAALDGGADGLDAYRAIAGKAGDHLAEDGWIGLEIGFDQRVDVTNIFTGAGFTLVDKASDYGGQDRVLMFRRAAER